MENEIISKELLSEVLGVNYDSIDLRNNILYITYNVKKYFDGNIKEINIHELANLCKDKVREYGYIVKSGFNDDIIEDDGSVAFDWKEIDVYQVEVKKVIYNYKDTLQDKIVSVAFFGGENLQELDIKACQWIYDNQL